MCATRKWSSILGVLLGLVLSGVFTAESAYAQDQVRTSFEIICPRSPGVAAARDGRMSAEVHAAVFEVGLHAISCAGANFVIEKASAVDVNALVLVEDGFINVGAGVGGSDASITLKLLVLDETGTELCTNELVLANKTAPGGFLPGVLDLRPLLSRHYPLSCHAELGEPRSRTTITAKVELHAWASAAVFAVADAGANVDLVSIGIVPYCEEVVVEASEGTVPLFSWYSPSRHDIFVTSDPEWAGCRGKVMHGDYRFVRLEGFVVDPSLSQPFGTVRLVSWWNGNEDHLDNFLTSDPEMQGAVGTVNEAGERLFRIEGFVYDPALGRPPGTVALQSYESYVLTDRFATTNQYWRSESADPRTGLGDTFTRPSPSEANPYDSYWLSRLEGYIYDPALPPPPVRHVSVSPESLFPSEPRPRGWSPAIEVQLVSWWHDGDADNFATAHPSWSGNVGDTNSEGYRLFRVEGHVFHPDLPQHRGTVPLVSWRSERFGDYLTTTDPNWQDPLVTHEPDYVFSHVEGYIYDPDLPQPAGTVPLVRWESEDRGDHFTTTDPNWQDLFVTTHWPDYVFSRLEGYVRP